MSVLVLFLVRSSTDLFIHSKSGLQTFFAARNMQGSAQGLLGAVILTRTPIRPSSSEGKAVGVGEEIAETAVGMARVTVGVREGEVGEVAEGGGGVTRGKIIWAGGGVGGKVGGGLVGENVAGEALSKATEVTGC